jgi:PAS domain S-box-containing protein
VETKYDSVLPLTLEGGRKTSMPRFETEGSHPMRWILQPRLLAMNTILVLVYFAAGRLGLSFALVNPSASPVWPASGVALAALLLFGPRVWPGIFVGAFLVNLSTSGRPAMSLGIAVGNTLEGVLGRYLVDRHNASRRSFDRLGDVWRFFALGGGVSTIVAATVGVTSLYLGGSAVPSEFGAVWLTWWLGDAVGVLIFTPLILLWANDFRLRWSREQAVEVAILLATIVLVGHALFGGWLPARLEHYPLDFLCIPMFVWVALRFSQREAATAVLVLSWIAISGTLAGVGPFIGTSQSDSLQLLQVFLGLVSVLTLALAAVVAEGRRGHEATARMATIVKSANDAIITKDLDGTITSWNPAAERMFGYAAGDVVGRNITIIIPEEYRHEETAVLGKIARGEIVDRFETVRTHKDGTRVNVSLTVSPVLSSDGRIIGASKIARDIGDRIRLEEARNALLAREQEARAEAEAGNRAKEEFLAILSHELRTPLNAVYGWARMMQTRELDDETSARALDAIVRNANAQVQLIDDLLDVSRVINGKMRLEVRLVDVKEVIEAALDVVGPSAEAKGVRVEAMFDPRGGLVNGDPGRLQQIVWNLAINAVKFTPAGGHVQVRAHRTNEHVEIIVSDTGHGIPAHVLPYVFDRFRQWDSSSTRAHSGLGLGLALVKHLTELHHGTVSAESAGEGKGATFKVALPRAVATPTLHGTPPTGSALSLEPGVRLEGLRILVVDDESDARELATTILDGAGATVKSCRSAADALAVLQGWRPDVLVSDIDMPGEDGYSLIRKIRELDEARGGRTPAVAVTAYGRTEDRVRTLSSGYSMHIPKPVDPDEFTTIIASVARVLRPPSR